MQENVAQALKTAIIKSLSHFQPLVVQFTEPYFEWHRGEQIGEWQGTQVSRPSLQTAFLSAMPLLNQLGSEFIQLFCTCYPKYENLVGFQSFGFSNLVSDPSEILRRILAELWDRYQTLELSDDQINQIIQEFADFVDYPTLRFRYIATLLNYKMDQEMINLTNDLSIRQLSEKEVSELYNKSRLSSNDIKLHDFILAGEFEEQKVFSDEYQETLDEPLFITIAKLNLDKAILALRTFKSGHIGYSSIRCQPTKFCPLAIPIYGFGNSYIPFGNYYISENDVEGLQKHSNLIFSSLDRPLEMACTRLADAESRTRPQDRLLDAVVGLEAILLAGLSKEDRRGELKFRFGLNYSTLFTTPETRLKEYRIAKSLYDLRSTIAHGSTPKERCKLGDQALSLNEAAGKACDVLRNVINYFFSYPVKSAYTKPEFWDNGYFGIKPRL